MDYEEEGKAIFQSAKTANLVNTLETNFETYVKLFKVMNRLRFKKYMSLIEEGFNNDQALDIVIKTKLLD